MTNAKHPVSDSAKRLSGYRVLRAPRFSDALRGGNDFLSVALLVYGPAVIVCVCGLKSDAFVANQTQVFSRSGRGGGSPWIRRIGSPPGWAVRKALHILWGRTKAQVLAPKCAKKKNAPTAKRLGQ